MFTQLSVPLPLERMFEHLHLNVERGFQVMPETMEDAMLRCRTCESFYLCEDDAESRYFTCPNRDLLDHLERLQG